MAWRIASRTTGSPRRETRRRRRLGICSPGWSQPITVPESMRPKAEALIRKLSERATRLCQSTSSILSRIRRSWVRASGIAQQGLGQAHEHDALVRAEAVGVHEGLDPALAHGLGTQAVGQAPGPGLDPLGRDGVEPQLAQQRHDRLRLVLLVGRGDAVAQRVAVMRRKVGEEGGRHGLASVVGQIAECGTAAASCKVPRQPSRNPILAVLSRSP